MNKKMSFEMFFGLPVALEESEYSDFDFEMSFDKFLTETLSIKETAYGTIPDCNDGNLVTAAPNKGVTFFKTNKQSYYAVFFAKTPLGYEVSFTKLKDFENHGDYISNVQFFDSLTGSREAFTVFGKVLYIVLDVMKKNDMDYVYFRGLTEKHTKIYEKIMQNENVKKVIKKEGFETDIQDTPIGKVFLIKNVF